jgi:hypothetical protein
MPSLRHGWQSSPSLLTLNDGNTPGEEHGTQEGKKTFQPGMTSETKDLYRENRRAVWQEWSPDDIDTSSKSTPKSAKFAIIVRREI